MSRLVVALVALAVFVATVVTTLPVDTVVRRILRRASPPTLTVTFDDASVGWRGITLRGVEATRAGRTVSRFAWLTVRPSVWGLLRGRAGHPLAVTGSTCDGWIEGVIDRDGPAVHLEAAFVDLELAPCAATWHLPGHLTGTVDGSLDLVVPSPGTAAGHGTLRLRSARWDVPGLPAHTPTSADHLRLDWTLREDMLTIADAELHNVQLQAILDGTVRLARPLTGSPIDLLLTVTPRSRMPQAHRDFLLSLPGGPPSRSGGRRFALGGTLGHPTIGRPAS